MKDKDINRVEIPDPPSHWNNRVIRRTHVRDEGVWITFGIHEVYYTDGKPTSCTENPVEPFGETIEELQEVMEHYRLALEKPTLDYGDF
jgi:hypothetical protein